MVKKNNTKDRSVRSTPSPAKKMEVFIKNLRLRTYIGIHKWEQEEKQDLVLNIRIQCHKDTFKSCRTDNIADTLNYKQVTKEIIHHIENNRFLLLERLVQEVMDMVLAHSSVSSVIVRAEKPGALRFSDAVGIELQDHNE